MKKQISKISFNFILVVLLEAILVIIGLQLRSIHSAASPVWPATGLGLFALEICGPLCAFAIFIGSFIAQFISTKQILLPILVSLASMAEAYIGYLVYHRIGRRLRDQLGDFVTVVGTLAAATAASLICATIGVASLAALGLIQNGYLYNAFFTWWTGDFVGAIAIFPALLSFKQFQFSLEKTRKREIAVNMAIAALTFLCLIFVFVLKNTEAFLFVVLISQLVAAIFLSRQWIFVNAITIYIFTLIATRLGHGPFVTSSPEINLLNSQLFLAGIALTALVLDYLKKIKTIRWATYALAIGWILSGFLFYSFYESAKKEGTNHISSLIDQAEISILYAFENSARALDAGSALLNIKPDANSEDWSHFADHLKLKQRFSGIYGIGVATFKNESELILKYFEPKGIYANRFNENIGSDQRVLDGAIRARDSGDVQLSEPTLIKDANFDKKGFYIFSPIYSRDVSTSTDRKRFLTGFVFAPIAAEDFLQSALRDYTNELRIRVYSSINRKKGELIYQSPDFTVNDREKIYLYGGQYFFVEWGRSPTFTWSLDKIAPWASFAGLLLTLFLALSLSTLEINFKKTNNIVEEKTAELLMTQQALIQSARMSSLGEMATSIAHEINNPLAVISSRSQMLMRASQAPLSNFKVYDMAFKIYNTAQRISKIVNSMRSISREGTNDPFEVVSIEKIVRDTLELCQEKFKNHGVELRVGYIPKWYILCREVQISQTLLNLLTNAHDAIEELEEKWVAVDFSATEDKIQIRVIDSGKGISPEVAQRIMQPFFTTKEVGKGTGLGLSLSKSLIEQHEGRLYIDETSPNTCFVIELPKSRLT